jgi:hypothetical protein
VTHWTRALTMKELSESMKKTAEAHSSYLPVFEFFSNVSIEWMLDITRDIERGLSQHEVEKLIEHIISLIKKELEKPNVTEDLKKHVSKLYYWRLTTGFNMH